jgi:hypothetical protein
MHQDLRRTLSRRSRRSLAPKRRKIVAPETLGGFRVPKHKAACRDMADQIRPIDDDGTWQNRKLDKTADMFSQFMASERTRPSQPFGGRTFRMKAMVRARSTTSESPYLPGLIQFGPYIASGTFVSYDHGDPWVEA